MGLVNLFDVGSC